MEVCPHCGHKRPVQARVRIVRVIIALGFVLSALAAGYYFMKQYRSFGKGNFEPAPTIQKPRPRDPSPQDPVFKQ